jgi:hypothetical protein
MTISLPSHSQTIYGGFDFDPSTPSIETGSFQVGDLQVGDTFTVDLVAYDLRGLDAPSLSVTGVSGFFTFDDSVLQLNSVAAGSFAGELDSPIQPVAPAPISPGSLLARDEDFATFPPPTVGPFPSESTFSYDGLSTGPAELSQDLFAPSELMTLEFTAIGLGVSSLFVEPGIFPTILDGNGEPLQEYLVDFGVAEVSLVPLPAAAWLFASALGVVGYSGWRRKKA